MTSVNPTLEPQTGLQSAKVSALEDTQHHRCALESQKFSILIAVFSSSNWSQGACQVAVAPLVQAIGLLHIHRHCLAGRSAISSHAPYLSLTQVVWAVSDVATVPPGSVLINPDNGTPYLNSDGSVYLFDPNNPPRLSPHGHRL